MKCTFLGTGYSITTPKRHNTSLFLQKGETGVLVDCNGVCVQRLHELGYLFEELDHIFLTHEHLDHIGALASFIHQLWLKSSYYRPENRRTRPINFYANARTVKMVQAVFDTVGLSQSPFMFPLQFHTLPDEGGHLVCGDIELDYFQVAHAKTPCFGISSRSGKRGLVYSADTEPVDRLYEQLQENDILIHECNSIDDPLSGGHTTLGQIKDIAPKYPSVRFYLVHLPEMDDVKEQAVNTALKISHSGQINLARDGVTLDV